MYLHADNLYNIFGYDLPTAVSSVYLTLVKLSNRFGRVDQIHYRELIDETGFQKSTVLEAFQILSRESYFYKLKNESDKETWIQRDEVDPDLEELAIEKKIRPIMINVFHPKRNGMYNFEICNNHVVHGRDQYLNLNNKAIWKLINSKPSTYTLRICLYVFLYAYQGEKKKLATISVSKLCEIIGAKAIYYIKSIIEKIEVLTPIRVTRDKNSEKKNYSKEILYFSKPKDTEQEYPFDTYKGFHHEVKSFCLQKGIDVGLGELHDTINLINQYHKKESDIEILKHIKDLIYKKREINSRYIHTTLRTLIGVSK